MWPQLFLSSCHWKPNNTFTQFYLKDVAWADSELFHLGLVVAAQQIHHCGLLAPSFVQSVFELSRFDLDPCSISIGLV